MYQLKTRQVCFILIAFFPLFKFFMMNSVIADISQNDMWISVLISLIVDYIAVFLILYTYKKTNKSFIQLLNDNFSEKITKIILGVFFIYFILKSILPIIDQKDYVIFTLYITTPRFLYFIPFLILSFYFCCQKLRALGRVSELCWILLIVGYIFLLLLSFNNADYGAIFPINNGNTKNILKGSFYSQNWFGDGAYFLFLIGNFKNEKKSTLKIMLSYLIPFVMVLLFSFMFYCIFSSIAFRQRFAMTEIAKYSTVINHIGRFDYVAIAFILFSNVFSLSLPLFFATRLLSYIFGFKKKWIPSLIVNGGVFLIVFLTLNNNYYIEKIIINYGSFLFLLIGVIVPLLTPLLTLKGGKNEVSEN